MKGSFYIVRKLLRFTRKNLGINSASSLQSSHAFVGRYTREQKRENENLRKNKCDHLNAYKDSLNIYKKS